MSRPISGAGQVGQVGHSLIISYYLCENHNSIVMLNKRIITLFFSILVCSLAIAQTNIKYQSQIKTSEALWKIESTKIGSAWMSGYHTVSLQVYVRKWTNLATNSKKTDIELRHDANMVLEKGDWNYVLNSLKYIHEALVNNPSPDIDYSFRTSSGLLFSTIKGELHVDVPNGRATEYKFTTESLGDFIEVLEKAIAQAK